MRPKRRRPRNRPLGPFEPDPTGLSPQQVQMVRAYMHLNWKGLGQHLPCLKQLGPNEPRKHVVHTSPMTYPYQGRLHYGVCTTCANKHMETRDKVHTFIFAQRIQAISDALKTFDHDSEVTTDREIPAAEDNCVKCGQTEPYQQIHFWKETWSTGFEDGEDGMPVVETGELLKYSLCSNCYPHEEGVGESEGSSAAEQGTDAEQASTDYGINDSTPGIGKGEDWKMSVAE